MSKKKRETMRIEINHDWCKTCYICIEICPMHVFAKADQLSKKGTLPVEIRDVKACKGCMLCELLCPDLAITVIKERPLEIEE